METPEKKSILRADMQITRACYVRILTLLLLTFVDGLIVIFIRARFLCCDFLTSRAVLDDVSCCRNTTF